MLLIDGLRKSLWSLCMYNIIKFCAQIFPPSQQDHFLMLRIVLAPLSNCFIISLVSLICSICYSRPYKKTDKLIPIWKTVKFPVISLHMEVFNFTWKQRENFSAAQGKLNPFHREVWCLIALQFGLTCLLKLRNSDAVMESLTRSSQFGSWGCRQVVRKPASHGTC